MTGKAKTRTRQSLCDSVGESSRQRPAVLYLLFLLSGLAGLIYEVMWMRSFSLVFGSAGETASAVLAAFFTGLAVGSWLGARLANQRADALWRYGIAELGVAASALMVPIWIALFGAGYSTLYRSGLGHGWVLTAIKLLLAFVALGIPCTAMGTTLPLITRALVGTAGHFGRRAGVAYALNTLGATTGALLAGFVLPPRFGVTNSIYAAAAINVAVGVVAITLSRREHAAKMTPSRQAGTLVPPLRRRFDPGLLLVVTLSGLGTLALEVLYTRLIVTVTDSCVLSFALMLGTFLVFLALASLVVSIAVDRLRQPWRFLAWTQTLGMITILAAPSVFQYLFDQADFERLGETLGEYLLKLALRCIAVMGPTVLLIGTALPTAWKIATRDASESGRNVGRLTAINTLAAVVGSVVTGFIVVPWIGIGRGIFLVAALYGVVAMVSWVRGYGSRPALAAGAVVVLLFAGPALLGSWNIRPVRLSPGDELIYFKEGKSVTVAVTKGRHGARILKVNQGYNLGGSGRMAVSVQRSQGGLPLMLHPSPRSSAFIGIATGVSVSSILEFPIRRVVAIELLPEVLEATRYFEDVNRRVLHDERVETLVADGRNHLFATRERFDVIVGDLFIPWHAGTGYLYTTEHFKSVDRRLNEGGIYAQWLPGHQLSIKQLRMIVATFLDVFPSATLWLNMPQPRWPILCLVGYADANASPSEDDRKRVVSSTTFPGLRYVCGPVALRRWASSAPRNSDNFPRVEYAGTGRFRRRENLLELHNLLEHLATRAP